MEVEETGNNEAAENSSDSMRSMDADSSMESEHNNNSTVSSPSPCQDDGSSKEE